MCLGISGCRTTRTASPALIEALALGPAHVAGVSWGGTVVQELYRHHPGLFAALILVDTYAGWKGSLPEEEFTCPGRGRAP
jgi:pimeloyl-ACP methyl ester carboxylesterase